MPLMGFCTQCGARTMAVGGAQGGGPRSRGNQLAAASLTDRRVGYVIESRSGGVDITSLICRECVAAAVQKGAA